jgi:anaerobic selenocysteine-containing dehydrogenase
MAKDEATPASRRGVFKASVAILAASAAGTAFAKAQPAASVKVAQSKIAKAMLMYQDTPKDGNHCGICAQFEPPDQCKIVEGPINPNGWCAAFAPKGA